MKTINEVQDPAKVAGTVDQVSDEQKVMTYNGIKEFNYFKKWFLDLNDELKIFSKLFNAHFNEILKSDKPFDKSWFLRFTSRTAINELNEIIETFVESQNKALKEHYKNYYKQRLSEVTQACEYVSEVYRQSNIRNSSILMKSLPIKLISAQNIPFAGTEIDVSDNYFSSIRDEFNEYIISANDVKFCELLQQIAAGYNGIAAEIQRRKIKLNMHGGLIQIPLYMDYDPTIGYTAQTANLKNVLDSSLIK